MMKIIGKYSTTILSILLSLYILVPGLLCYLDLLSPETEARVLGEVHHGVLAHMFLIGYLGGALTAVGLYHSLSLGRKNGNGTRTATEQPTEMRT